MLVKKTGWPALVCSACLICSCSRKARVGGHLVTTMQLARFAPLFHSLNLPAGNTKSLWYNLEKSVSSTLAVGLTHLC